MAGMTSVYARAVRKAAELVGGRARLARMLQVPADEIEKWISEERKPPREIFLRVVDIIIDDSGLAPDAGAPETPPAKDASGASYAQFD
jgi:hypothetical protein